MSYYNLLNYLSSNRCGNTARFILKKSQILSHKISSTPQFLSNCREIDCSSTPQLATITRYGSKLFHELEIYGLT